MKTIELKRCPFCGGEAELKEGKVYIDRCIRARCKNGCVSSKPILIDHPRVTTDGLDESTRYTEEQAKQEAAKMWNRRVNREQSESEWLLSPDGINPIRCKNCNTPALFIFYEDDFGDSGFCRYPSRFCPNCGDKMKGGDSLERKEAMGSGAEEEIHKQAWEPEDHGGRDHL